MSNSSCSTDPMESVLIPLPGGGELQADLRVVAAESFGAALQYFTGSKEHNVRLREIAVKKKWRLNEYGLFRGKRRIAGRSEKKIFAAIGLPYIPPELRENRGEIEAAHAGLLPKLVELADLRGDLHAHTRASDGHESLRGMAAAAAERGLEYLAITEHSKRLTVAHGLDSKRLLAQLARFFSEEQNRQLLREADSADRVIEALAETGKQRQTA